MRVRIAFPIALVMSFMLALAAVASDSGFIENRGQIDARVGYYAQAAGGTVYLTRAAIVIDLREARAGAWAPGLPTHADGGESQAEPTPLPGCAVYLHFEGANPAPIVEAREVLQTRYNYFLGDDPARWRTEVPAFGAIVYRELWPGVDVVFRCEIGRIVYSLEAAPGADLSAVRLSYEGADRVAPDESGIVRIETQVGAFTHRLAVPGASDGWIGALGDAAPSRADSGEGWRDDPSVLQWSTFLGGSDYDYGEAVDIDASGNPVVAGYTLSPDFPVTPGAYDQSLNSASFFDAFVTKFSASGTSLLWSTYLGGSGGEGARAIDIDQEGRIVVAGSTESPNFPTLPGAYDRTHNGDYDFFVVKLTSTGSSLVWGTYLGGTGSDVCWDMDLDSSMNPAVIGQTASTAFPTTAGAFDSSLDGSSDAVVAKISSGGSSLLMSTYLGGTQYEYGYAIAVDTAGNPIATGTTASGNFPTTPDSYDPSYNYSNDAFLTKVSSSGTSLLWSSFLGGSGGEQSWGLALDTGGNPVVTGRTSSTNFPTTAGAYDRTFNASVDMYVAKLTADGSDLLWGTYLGGNWDDECWDLDLAPSGAPIVVGNTNSGDYPTTAHAYQGWLHGEDDIVVSMLSSTGSSLVWSTHLGGGAVDDGYAIVVDSSGDPIVVGYARSDDFPTTPGAFDTTKNPWDDGIVAKFTLAFMADADDAPAEAATMRLRGDPNPASGAIAVAYTLPRAMDVDLRILDASGRAVVAWEPGNQPAGSHDIVWDGRDAAGRRIAPGVYFARLSAGGEVAVRKIVIAD